MKDSFENASRRNALRTIGWGTFSLAALFTQGRAIADEPSHTSVLTQQNGATALKELGRRLAAAPRRRNFDSVPFMVTDQKYWDHEAAAEVLSYKGGERQMWENSQLDAAWPGLMRESMNNQNFGFHHPDFLAVSATHGIAHLALFSQSMWDKYNLAALAGPKFTRNTLIVEKDGVSPSDSLEDVDGFYGPFNNNVISLQRRGAVFVACHDSIHATARALHAAGTQSSLSADQIAADLTNNLITDAVLVPSIVGFMVELQSRGFTYAKGS